MHHTLAYIKRTQSRERARYVRLGIHEAALHAALMPEKHQKELAFERADIRYVVKWRFKIVFMLTEESIIILRVFHASQNPDKLTID